MAGRGGPQDAGTGDRGEFGQDRADTTVHPVHEDRLPGPHAGGAVQHAPGRQAVDDERRGRRRVQARRHGHEGVDVDDGVRRPPARAEERRDPVPTGAEEVAGPTAWTVPTRS
ncbi:hypothetical protein GCM10027519_25530 [Kineococcus endophyticus]